MASLDAMFEPADLRDLTEVGFMALTHGLIAPAEAVFAALKVLRPHEEAGWVGLALALLHRQDVDGAVASLRGAPPTDAVRTFLGLALERQGRRTEARDMLADVVATGRDAAATATAQDLLQAVEAQP